MRTAALALAVALLVADPVGAGDLAVRERSDQDRREGLRDELVRGETYELLGVQLTSSADTCAPAIGSATDGYLHLVVPEEAGDELKAEVRELPSNYSMRPASFSSAGFRWKASEVIEPAGIAPERLGVLVRSGRRKLYLPALLAPEARLPRSPGYRFVYEMAGTWQLDWKVHRAKEAKSVVASGKAGGGRGLASFCWNGRTAGGAAVESGEYVLRGELKMRTGQPITETVHVRFRKYREPLR